MPGTASFSNLVMFAYTIQNTTFEVLQSVKGNTAEISLC